MTITSPLPIIMDRYLDYLAKERALSGNTVMAYRRDLESLISCLGVKPEESDICHLTPAAVRGWLANATKKGLSPLTIKRRLSAAKGLCAYIVSRESPDFPDPTDGLSAPKAPKPLPAYIKPSETTAMLDEAALPATPRLERLIVELLYSTGLRCQELIDLRNEGVDTERGLMRVMGKRRKERIVPLTKSVAALIDDYRLQRGTDAGPLLLRDDGTPLSRRKVYEIVHRMMVDNGVHATRLSPHTLRHSCATDLLNNGADLNAVKELLGHASLTTTQVYTHLNYNDLLKNYAAAHPRSKQP